MWIPVLLLTLITCMYAGYNLLVKVSSTHVPAAATSTVFATICLQVTALTVSGLFLAGLLMQGGHVLRLSTPAYLWAAGAGACIGVAEVAYFYLFRGAAGAAPVAASVAVPIIVCGTVAITALVSYFVFREAIGPAQMAGIALVVAGVGLIFTGSA